MKPQNYKICFYIRVSTEEQAENPEGSIKNQEERLAQTVRLKNMEDNFGEVVGIYIDRAKSGKDTNRPELQKMLQAIRAKKINLVMVSELSRISRNMRDFSDIWEMMKATGCGFYSLRENFDTTSAAGEMVLYTLANLAQFERRQVSERVTANMNARAARGLYNGGSVPVGYKLVEEKPGTLAVDEDRVHLVRAVFDAFKEQGTLSQTARWLNGNNYKPPKRVEGGGKNARLDFFTVDNVHHILRNKVYIGIREYKQNGEAKEVIAQWEPIVDREIFDYVQKTLSNNLSSKKPLDGKKHPYILTGLVRCATCGLALVGKSAHGKRQKIAYYEHSWATKRNSALTEKIFKCEPTRILGNKLESVVLEQLKLLLGSKETSKELLQEAVLAFEKGSPKKQIDRLKASVYGYNSQLEALAERLGQLPKSVNPKPFFLQMEKIEKQKRDCEKSIQEIQSNGEVLDKPIELSDYRKFLDQIKGMFNRTDNKEIQAQIIKWIISKIEVGPDFVRVHYKVGENLAHMDVSFKGNLREDNAFDSSSPDLGGCACSNSLTSGTRDRA